jgi:hypothetical protein
MSLGRLLIGQDQLSKCQVITRYVMVHQAYHQCACHHVASPLPEARPAHASFCTDDTPGTPSLWHNFLSPLKIILYLWRVGLAIGYQRYHAGCPVLGVVIYYQT